MARAGSSLQTTIDVAGRSTADVNRAVVGAMSVDGVYRSAPVGPDSVQFVRTYRPAWATTLGVLGLVVFGLGILFFFVRRTETCTMTVVNGPTGAVLTITGKLLPGRLDSVKAALAVTGVGAGTRVSVGRPSATSAHASPTGPQPVIVSPIAVPATPTGSPPDGPLSAVVVVGSHEPSQAAEMTVDRGAVTSIPASSVAVPPGPWAASFSIRLADGRSLPLQGTTLLGRDPSPRPGDDQQASLVPLVDPAMQVSKTHLALRVDHGSLLAEDLHSTNGTGVTDPSGRHLTLLAGQPERIEPGSQVHLGALCLEVRCG